LTERKHLASVLGAVPHSHADEHNAPHDEGLDPEQLALAQKKAERLEAEVRERGLEPAFAELERAVAEYERETGGTVDELLPPGVEALAFRVPGADRARRLARAWLCTDKDRLRPAIQAGTQASAAALVPTLGAALPFGPLAPAVVVVFATVLAVRGVDGFCADTDGNS
jgi:hypothetical protein